jgi:hypothetical protein
VAPKSSLQHLEEPETGSYLKPVEPRTSYFFRIHLTIKFPSMPKSASWSLTFSQQDNCEISGSHGGEYEDESLLGYSTM